MYRISHNIYVEEFDALHFSFRYQILTGNADEK